MDIVWEAPGIIQCLVGEILCRVIRGCCIIVPALGTQGEIQIWDGPRQVCFQRSFWDSFFQSEDQRIDCRGELLDLVVQAEILY